MAGTWEPGQAEHQKAGQSTLVNCIKIDIDDISLIVYSKE